MSEKKKLDTSNHMRRLVVPNNVKEKNFWKRLTLFQFIYSIIGLILSLACIIGGMILFINGVTGSTSWTAKFIGVESNISDAAPGVILFIVGLLIIWITRFSVNVKK